MAKEMSFGKYKTFCIVAYSVNCDQSVKDFAGGDVFQTSGNFFKHGKSDNCYKTAPRVVAGLA